jgi:SAM-dependent methyltransferase
MATFTSMRPATVLCVLLPAFLPLGARAQEGGDGGRAPDVVFVATPPAVVTGMLELAGVGDSDVVYDLGSGDGRIVIAAARRGARGVGVELEPSLVADSRVAADTAGVGGRVEFRRGDIFDTDLREATVVTLYLGLALNERLRPIFLRELRPGSRVVSQAFDMGDWRPDSVVVIRARDFAATPVYLWLIPARLAGSWALTVGEAARSGDRVQLTFRQRYQMLEGSVAVRQGTVPLSGLRLRGDSLAFSFEGRRFAGRVLGNEASGTVVAADGVRSRWRAARAGPP